MNENINLVEILKGHEGESFYSPVLGKVVVTSINRFEIDSPIEIHNGSKSELLTSDGKLYDINDSECMLFPSKDQRDWNKWAEEQKPKVQKTWNTFVNQLEDVKLKTALNNINLLTEYCDSNGKAAIALFKIHLLIEKYYESNITNDEWNDSKIEKFIIVPTNDGFKIDHRFKLRAFRHIAFHTKQQAEEFISYTENVQLLKDYFIL